jgi:MYXO-CTERM domain-containing protein
VDCDPAAQSCGVGNVCSTLTPFSEDAGVCVAGCNSDLDCEDGGEVCSTCERICELPGTTTAGIGDPCVQATDCPAGSTCINEEGFFRNGYCTQPCAQGVAAASACGCPSGSACDSLRHFGLFCLQTCGTVGAACGQSGYICQPYGNGNSCLPACQILTSGSFSFDSCLIYASNLSCDASTGICNPLPDGGSDAGPGDAGTDGGPVDVVADGGGVTVPDAGNGGGPSSSGHSGSCATGTGGTGALWGLVGLVALLRRRRD